MLPLPFRLPLPFCPGFTWFHFPPYSSLLSLSTAAALPRFNHAPTVESTVVLSTLFFALRSDPSVRDRTAGTETTFQMFHFPFFSFSSSSTSPRGSIAGEFAFAFVFPPLSPFVRLIVELRVSTARETSQRRGHAQLRCHHSHDNFDFDST